MRENMHHALAGKQEYRLTEKDAFELAKEEDQLLRFAARWAPYGGPPAGEVLITFGMTLPRYEFRVCEALARRRNRTHPDYRTLAMRSRWPAIVRTEIRHNVPAQDHGARSA
ncbi:hypothetical protein [Rhodococcus sp. NPDC057529]|uniref:hypothetical protein n=1 Tax=Rhodococcus sp. NPDC057529 TaxID=3346158 RepID=UPI00366F93D2